MLRVSKTWHTKVLAPCLWTNIKLEGKPRWHLVALRSFFARARNAPVAVEIETGGQNAGRPDSPFKKTGVLELLQEHVSHIRALNLRVYNRMPGSRGMGPLEGITRPEFSALRSLLNAPMPILETFTIKVRWDVLSQAIPRPFNGEAPNLRTVKLLFQGQTSQIPDARMFPQVQSWQFQRQDYPLIWPWDWNAIWSALSSQG